MLIAPRGWSEFQHYKDRNPPWIRLHRSLLDNRDFNAMPPMVCKVLVLLWLVAAEGKEGAFKDDADELAFRLRLPVKDVAHAVAYLKEKRFLVAAGSADAASDGRPVSQQIAEGNGFGSRHISDKTKRAAWERDGGRCCACSATSDIEYDHIVPVSKGGNSELSNIQLLCRPCNRKKRTKTAEQVATPAQPDSEQVYSEAEALQRTETEAETDSGTAPIGTAPPPPPPAFDGNNAQALNGKHVVPIAAGFELPEPWGYDAEALGWKPAEVIREAEKFRQYWTAGKGSGTRRSVKSWRQSWSTWLQKAAEQRR